MSQMTRPPPLQLIVGPAGHGVARYAADLAGVLRRVDPRTPVVSVALVADALPHARKASRSHLHVTNRLLGSTPEEAAENLERLASVTRLTITVHDVPQASDGTGLARRIAAYERFLAAAQAAVVNSRHEQALVSEFLPAAPLPHAIPLGSQVAATPERPVPECTRERGSDGQRDLTVLLAGYIYPGKGHTAAIGAAAHAAEILRSAGEPVGHVRVRAIGGPSPGHERDVDELRKHADSKGVLFEMTGFLSGEEFTRSMTGDGIPLAAHEHFSASRSMLDWVEAGRRPLVVSSRYAREMAELRPGTIALYDPADLSRALAEAWGDSSHSWLAGGIPLTPTLADAAAAYRAWWDDLAP